MNPKRRWLAPADAVLQQGAWWCAVLLAARGANEAAAAAGFALLAVHLALRPGERRRVASTALAAVAYGFLTDSALASAGLADFAGSRHFSPAWMVALWAAFGASLTASLAGVAGRRPFVAGLLAALAGPLSYRAGAGLGALAFPGGTAPALAAVAVQWAIGVPWLSWLARERTAQPAPSHAGTGTAGWWRWAR